MSKLLWSIVRSKEIVKKSYLDLEVILESLEPFNGVGVNCIATILYKD